MPSLELRRRCVRLASCANFFRSCCCALLKCQGRKQRKRVSKRRQAGRKGIQQVSKKTVENDNACNQVSKRRQRETASLTVRPASEGREKRQQMSKRIQREVGCMTNKTVTEFSADIHAQESRFSHLTASHTHYTQPQTSFLHPNRYIRPKRLPRDPKPV